MMVALFLFLQVYLPLLQEFVNAGRPCVPEYSARSPTRWTYLLVHAEPLNPFFWSFYGNSPLLLLTKLLTCTYRIIRLTSPNLNYIIISGAILLYVSVILFVFPTTDKSLATFVCQVREVQS